MSDQTGARGARAVPAEQRLFSLVLALVASAEGLTKRELLSSVFGYAEKYLPGERNSALERQFERDKDVLRSLGIRIETLDSPLEPGNNQLARYRISKDQLDFPSDLRFDERELMLMRLAALAWRDSSMTAESRRALMKLEALGAGLDVRHLGVAPSLGEPEPAAAPLQAAIEAGSVVAFDYALPGRDVPARRRVAPLRLHRADGRWHLISWDLERNDGRVFLLTRIRSAIETTRERFDPALLDARDALVEKLLEQAERNRATVDVAAGSTAEARLAPRATVIAPTSADGIRLTVPTLDLHALADELAAFGGDAVVIEPVELRELVIQRLTDVLTKHDADAPPLEEPGAERGRVTHTARRGLPAADAVTLMLSIVPYLLDHGPTPLDELSEAFGVEPERLRSDIIPFLGMSGVPGETRTYQHEDLFDIDWDSLEHGIVSLVRTVAVDDAPRFAPAETAALIAGLQSLAALLPESDAEIARATARKLGAVMGETGRDSAPSLTESGEDPSLPVIVAAVDEQRELSFEYRDAAGRASARVVKPHSLAQEGGAWYVRGFCRDRRAERTFRVDRMRDIRVTDAALGSAAGSLHQEDVERTHAQSFDLIARLPERLLTRFRGFAPEVLGRDSRERVRVRIDAWHAGSAVRLVQEAPGDVVVEGPEAARAAVARWAERALAAYDA